MLGRVGDGTGVDWVGGNEIWEMMVGKLGNGMGNEFGLGKGGGGGGMLRRHELRNENLKWNGGCSWNLASVFYN